MQSLCPCCGCRSLQAPPGLYEICPVCFWEDDPRQRENPAYAGGANGLSLVEARENYARFGACEERLLPLVRPPLPEEQPPL